MGCAHSSPIKPGDPNDAKKSSSKAGGAAHTGLNNNSSAISPSPTSLGRTGSFKKDKATLNNNGKLEKGKVERGTVGNGNLPTDTTKVITSNVTSSKNNSPTNNGSSNGVDAPSSVLPSSSSSSSSTTTPATSSSSTTSTTTSPPLDPTTHDVMRNMVLNAWGEESSEALLTLLRSPHSVRRYFEDFLRREYNEEHLHFVLAVETLFRDHHSSSLSLSASAKTEEDSIEKQRMLWASAREIFETHIKAGASEQVNLSAKSRDAEFTEENFTEFLLNCQNEVIRMLSLDTFPRFLKSSECQAMLDHIQTTPTSTPSPTLTAAAAAAAAASTTNTTTATALSRTSTSDSSSSSAASASSSSLSSALHSRIYRARTGLTEGTRQPQQWLESFKAVAELLPSAVVIADMSLISNPIIFVNREFTRITGFSSEDSVGKNCRFLQGSNTDPATVQLLRQAIRDGVEISLEIMNYKKDGTPFRNFLSLRPVYYSAGNNGAFFGSPSSRRLQANLQSNEAVREVENEGEDAASPQGSLVFSSNNNNNDTTTKMTAQDADQVTGDGKKEESGSSATPSAAALLAPPSPRSSSASSNTHSPAKLFPRSQLAYFIGVQYEVTDDSLIAQRLLRHEALLRMLPSQVL